MVQAPIANNTCEEQSNTHLPFIWDTLGDTLEDIRLGFGVRSHYNKDINSTLNFSISPAATHGRKGLMPQRCLPMLCHCWKMYFPSHGPTLLQLCAGSSLNHHHHHHTWLIFTPTSNPEVASLPAADSPRAGCSHMQCHRLCAACTSTIVAKSLTKGHTVRWPEIFCRIMDVGKGYHGP